jgi:hypothetical protein
VVERRLSNNSTNEHTPALENPSELVLEVVDDVQDDFRDDLVVRRGETHVESLLNEVTEEPRLGEPEHRADLHHKAHENVLVGGAYGQRV